MTVAKWCTALVCVLAVALAVLVNVLITARGSEELPEVVNTYAVGVAVTAGLATLLLHLHSLLDAKLNLTIEVLISRFDDVTERVGDRNSAFIEGYVLGREPDPLPTPAPVLPMRVLASRHNSAPR